MARNISPAGLAKLAESYATEPIIIIEIQWRAGGTWTSYADRDINPSIAGRILEVSNLDSVVGVSNNSSSQELSVTLSDTDGTIKAILNAYDIVKRDVRVYQWFEGLSLSDKFLLFQGKINSPVAWSERNRTVSFSLLTQIEDHEIGFSPEEGQFSNIPNDLIGKPWPMVFGTYVNTPALRLDVTRCGSLGEGVGLRDFTVPYSLGALNEIISFLTSLQAYWAIASAYLSFIGAEQAADAAEQRANSFAQQQQQMVYETGNLASTHEDQIATEKDSFRVIGGRDFPQHTTLVLDVNGAQFTGSFDGDVFNVQSAKHPEYDNFTNAIVIGGIPTNPDNQKRLLPSAEGFTIIQNGVETFIPTGNIFGENAGPFFAQAGSQVRVYSREPVRYVASITPGQVRKVAAYATFQGGQRHLIDVPSNLYSVSVENFGPVAATIITINDALSKNADSGFEDEIYVSFESSVGPNTVDIMEYLIDLYTDFEIDETSFEHVKDRLANYPSHFCLTERKQILTALQEIAMQARCAIWLNNGVFHLRYLPEAPTSVATFSESDVDGEENSDIQVSYSNTDNLTTKLVAKWRAHGAQDVYNRTILRHNVSKYGIQEQEFDWYIYNNADLVYKAASFWLIRLANTWKQVKFTGFIDKLNVETFDGVTLDFDHDYVANESVLGVVERADYDSSSNSIAFEIWTPVRSGEMTAYNFSYPADIDSDLRFPTPAEENSGNAGGDGPGRNATGGQLGNNRGSSLTVEYNGLSDPFRYGARRYQDRGALRPSDQGDQHPGAPVIATNAGAASSTPAPPTPIISTPPIVQQPFPYYLDIRTTEILDSVTGERTVLASFFHDIAASDGLRMKTGAKLSDGSNSASFDFQFDGETGQWGAGTAFLQD